MILGVRAGATRAVTRGRPGKQMKSKKNPFRGLWLALVLLAPLVRATAAPPAPTADYEFALIEFRAGAFEQARATLEEALRISPRNAAAQMLLARCYYELRDYKAAVAHAQAAVKAEPDNAQDHLWLGRMLGREADQEHSATLALKTRKEFKKAVSLDPRNVEARRALMEYDLQAPWILGGSKAKAREQAESISRLNRVEGLLAQARLAEADENTRQADSDYQAVMQAKPRRVGPYFEAAEFYVAQQNKAGLEQAIDGATSVAGNDPRLNFYRGVEEVLAGRLPATAERNLENYLAQRSFPNSFPSRAEAMSWLGRLYERTGKTQLAIRQYLAALQLDPDCSLAQEALQRLGINP